MPPVCFCPCNSYRRGTAERGVFAEKNLQGTGRMPAAGIVTVSGGMEGLCRGYRRLAGSARCGFRRLAGHLNAAAEADGYGRRRHRCGSSCATGAGRTDPAAGNGTEYRCAPAQGARRDRIGTPQTKKAALAGSLYRGYTTGLQGNLTGQS